MVPRPRPSLLLFPWRLSYLYCFDHSRRHSLLPQRSSSKVGKREQKGPTIRPCSAKMLQRTHEEHKGTMEVVKENSEEISKATTTTTTTTTMEDETKVEEVFRLLPGIPVVPSNRTTKPRVTFVFEKASLVPALVGKTYQILNAEDHAGFLRRKKLDPYIYRPDIIFEALLEVTESNLYKEGHVHAIYVKTDQGVLIKIEPNTRLPSTFRSFCSMMLELLQKFNTKAKGKGGKLLRLVKNPVTQYLPVSSLKIGFSHSSPKVVPLKDYVGAISSDVDLVFVVGAMAHGKIDCDYADELISVSQFPLSAVCCLRRIYRAVEKKWKIAD